MKPFRFVGLLSCLIVAGCAQAGESPAGHVYTNGVWIMKEGTLPVLDPGGKPADLQKNWQRVGPAKLKIIWTHTHDYKWNYTTNTPPRTEGLPGPSVRVFLKKQLAAKSVVWTVIPDTPFRIATLNGKVTPVLWDTDKAVLWKLVGLEQTTGNSDTIVVKDRKVELIQSGGDWFAFLTLDLSDGSKGIRVQYRERFDGY